MDETAYVAIDDPELVEPLLRMSFRDGIAAAGAINRISACTRFRDRRHHGASPQIAARGRPTITRPQQSSQKIVRQRLHWPRRIASSLAAPVTGRQLQLRRRLTAAAHRGR